MLCLVLILFYPITTQPHTDRKIFFGWQPKIFGWIWLWTFFLTKIFLFCLQTITLALIDLSYFYAVYCHLLTAYHYLFVVYYYILLYTITFWLLTIIIWLRTVICMQLKITLCVGCWLLLVGCLLLSIGFIILSIIDSLLLTIMYWLHALTFSYLLLTIDAFLYFLAGSSCS